MLRAKARQTIKRSKRILRDSLFPDQMLEHLQKVWDKIRKIKGNVSSQVSHFSTKNTDIEKPKEMVDTLANSLQNILL